MQSLLRKVRRFSVLSRETGFSWALITVSHELRRLARRLGKGRHFPNSMQLELSSFCNMDCSYCALRDRMPMGEMLNPKVFEAIKPSIKYMRRIQLSGLGEPTVNKGFADYVRAIKKESKGCHVVAFSNVTLLREESARRLIKSGLDSLVFSLDGIDHELINSIRHGAKNEKVLENVRMLQELKEELGSRTPVLGATMVMQKKNYHQILPVIEAIADLGIASLGINGVDPLYPDLVDEVLWDPDTQPDDLAEVLEQAFQRASELKMNMIIPSFQPQAPDCPENRNPIVMANGDVAPCSQMAYPRDGFLTISDELDISVNPGGQKKLIFGNVLEKGLEQIWNSQSYSGFRETVRAGRFPESCSRCNVKHSCIASGGSLTPDKLMSEFNG